MKTCLISEQIGILIRKDELFSAIKLVNQALKGAPLLDEAIIHSRVYSDLVKKIRSGQISLEDENITKNKISYALMDLAREIETQYNENPEIRSQVDEFYGSEKESRNYYIYQTHHGKGDNVGGDKVIHNYKPSPTTGNISNSKNVIQGSTISVGGNFRLGDDIRVSGNNVRIGDEIILQVFQNKGIDEVIDHLNVQMNISESNRLKDLGRFKIQDFGKEAIRNWNEHAWHLLGQALGYFTESIGKNPKNEHAWTNLAYTYYLIGEKVEADRCLEVSKSLAGPGPNYPGRHYKSVEKAIRSGRTIHGVEMNRPPRPAWFDEKHLRHK